MSMLTVFSDAAAKQIVVPSCPKVDKQPRNTIYPMHQNQQMLSSQTSDMTLIAIDQLLEREKVHNKLDTWNKLDKTMKLQKLHGFAERYGKGNGFATKIIVELKTFFTECLEKNKLQKTKELVYDKEHQEITSIPSLYLNTTTSTFTLRIMDNKRVSTLKALTPLKKKEP